MFPSGPFDIFYAPHNPVASTVMNMTFSLTDPRNVKGVMRDVVSFWISVNAFIVPWIFQRPHLRAFTWVREHENP